MTSYTIYRFRMKPCCPRMVTLALSCFFHQCGGRPVPKLAAGPLVAAGPVIVKFHGSSEYAGACLGEVMRSETGETANVDEEGARRSRSREGSGRVLCCDSAATCSMLTSRNNQHLLVQGGWGGEGIEMDSRDG